MKNGFQNYRIDDIDRALSRMSIRPLDLLVVGATGAGKSTTLNAFFRDDVAEVGCGVDPKTMQIDFYSLNGLVRYWDTPGLGDNVEADRKHQILIQEKLHETYGDRYGVQYGFIDLVLVIADGSSRDLGTIYRLLRETILPNIDSSRVLVALNQADMSMAGRHWNAPTSTPDAELLARLKEQAASVKKRIDNETGKCIPLPVFYSALHGYNVKALYDFIIDHIPASRRRVI